MSVRFRQSRLRLGLVLLLTIVATVVAGSGSKASAHIYFPGDRNDHPRGYTSYRCGKTGGEIGGGTLGPNGDYPRFRVYGYSVDGDDLANAHYGEAGSWIQSNNNCGSSNPFTPWAWGDNGSSNTTVYTTNSAYNVSGDPFDTKSVGPIDMWLGAPAGGTPDLNTTVGAGSLLYRGLYGIYQNSSRDNWGVVNDAGAVRINGQEIWCLGMYTMFYPGCAGPNAHEAEYLGCDCYGFLRVSRPNGYDVVKPAFQPYMNQGTSVLGVLGIPKNPGAWGRVQPFTLNIDGMNTQDDGNFGLAFEPTMNTKASQNLTYVYPRANPVGNFDGLQPAGSCTAMVGWALDSDNIVDPLGIHIYVDGVLYDSTVKTTLLRSSAIPPGDVNEQYG